MFVSHPSRTSRKVKKGFSGGSGGGGSLRVLGLLALADFLEVSRRRRIRVYRVGVWVDVPAVKVPPEASCIPELQTLEA